LLRATSAEFAKRYLALLNGQSFNNKEVPMPSEWQLNYSGIIVDCRDEQARKAWRGRSSERDFGFPLGQLKGP
jgi:hypothetical protein